MKRYKRNQVEDAIFRTFGAQDARVNELKLRLKRLLAIDRQLSRQKKKRGRVPHRAFSSHEPPGSGVEIRFSGYEAFALFAAIMLLEHGLPQGAVVRLMRQVRPQLEAAHAQTLKKDPAILFDQQAIRAQAKPGMIATDNTDPVFLVFVRLTDSSVGNQKGGTAVAVCQGPTELGEFLRRHSVPGMGATFFEFVRLMHTLAAKLSETRAIKRGRGRARATLPDLSK